MRMTKLLSTLKRYAQTLRILVLVWLIGIAFVGCRSTSENADPLTPVTVQLSWLHYASFGSLYAADQNGYYADHGLDVTFLEGGPSVDHLASVLNGEAQFGVLGADELILARAEGKPVRAIAVILRHSPAVFVAKSNTGISKPQDFVGKTIRVTPQLRPTLHTITAAVGVKPAQYEEVILPSDLALFEDDAADVWSVYYNSFAVTLQAEGHDLNFIFPQDYGVHFYNDTLFTTDTIIEQEPELVDQFLRATLQGMRYAIENPETVGQMVRSYEPTADVVIETQKAIASIPLISSGSAYMGDMSPDVWAEMHEILVVQGVLGEPIDITTVYTREFMSPIIGDRDETEN